MQTLLSELEGNKAQDSHDSDGKSWARIKAISSAISREAPTISGDVNTDFLAPLPNIRISGNLQHQMENLQKKRDARKSAIPSIPEWMVVRFFSIFNPLSFTPNKVSIDNVEIELYLMQRKKAY